MVKGFKEYNKESELSVEIANVIEFFEFSNMEFGSLNESELNEFKMPDIDGALKKAGLHVKKGRGLIQMIASSGLHFARVFHAAIRAAGGDKGAEKTLRELLSKKISKEDVIDFLLKLDQATLHIVTGPIHFIEAVTGWHIWAAVHKVRDVSKDILQKGKDIISKLKDISQDLEGSGKKYIEKVSKSVEKFFLPKIDPQMVKA